MEAKHALLGSGGVNPFVDPEGYYRYVSEKEKAFKAELERQKVK